MIIIAFQVLMLGIMIITFAGLLIEKSVDSKGRMINLFVISMFGYFVSTQL